MLVAHHLPYSLDYTGCAIDTKNAIEINLALQTLKIDQGQATSDYKPFIHRTATSLENLNYTILCRRLHCASIVDQNIRIIRRIR
jgi:hypothetical protein